jgi:hypothetical protein
MRSWFDPGIGMGGSIVEHGRGERKGFWLEYDHSKRRKRVARHITWSLDARLAQCDRSSISLNILATLEGRAVLHSLCLGSCDKVSPGSALSFWARYVTRLNDLVSPHFDILSLSVQANLNRHHPDLPRSRHIKQVGSFTLVPECHLGQGTMSDRDHHRGLDLPAAAHAHCLCDPLRKG